MSKLQFETMDALDQIKDTLESDQAHHLSEIDMHEWKRQLKVMHGTMLLKISCKQLMKSNKPH